MKTKSIFMGLMALCAVCILPAAGYSQSTQIGITDARARALWAAGVGLFSLVVGGLALARSAGRIGTPGAIAALVMGLIGVVLSVVHISGSTGFGTGGGRAGAIVALVLALIGFILGGLALARSHHNRIAD
jgi:hypothetical protein